MQLHSSTEQLGGSKLFRLLKRAWARSPRPRIRETQSKPKRAYRTVLVVVVAKKQGSTHERRTNRKHEQTHAHEMGRERKPGVDEHAFEVFRIVPEMRQRRRGSNDEDVREQPGRATRSAHERQREQQGCTYEQVWEPFARDARHEPGNSPGEARSKNENRERLTFAAHHSGESPRD
jgi:hypothetical protein